MKMSVKLIIMFSALTIIIAVIFGVFSYQSSLTSLRYQTYSSLNTYGEIMQDEIENYYVMMSYAAEELTSNVDFMDALYSVYSLEEENDPEKLIYAQTLMSRVMYQIPLQSAFYRISVYTRDGFYLTDRFEKTDDVVSYSDDAIDIINSLDYLSAIDENPYRPMVVAPHPDPWSMNRNIDIFSYVKAIFRHGECIGYLEVAALVEDLTNIFNVDTFLDIHTQAAFSDGRLLYSEEDVSYDISTVGQLNSIIMENGEERWVVLQHSKTLDLNIFVSMDMSSMQKGLGRLVGDALKFLIPVLIIALILIIIISYTLTRSIIKLNRKMKQVPADSFLSGPDPVGPIIVTSKNDREIYELELSFNDLLTRLRNSHANEMSLREGALKAQLNALQLQINPHFVYNTLNIISAKGLESGNDEISELCDQFAQMLRYSTDIRTQTATLKNEIDNVRTYLYLCKARYEDMLEYTIDVPDSLLGYHIPKLTLQPLVENALKYGNKSALVKRMVAITGSLNDNILKLEIRDNGNGFPADVLKRLLASCEKIESGEMFDQPDTAQHLGIINTYRRLFYYSSGNIRMNLYNDNGAVVEIKEIIKGTYNV